MMKIMIGIPSADLVHADFAMSLAAAIAVTALEAGDKIQLTINNAKGCSVERNHYRMAKDSLEAKADALLIIGSDMTFPPHTIMQLASANKDIVACNAARRVHPHNGVAYDLDGNPVAVKDCGLIECSQIGSGIMLVSTGVFKKLAEPWFTNRYVGKGVFDSCDYTFCNQARAFGFKIWCDTNLSMDVGHVGSTTHYLEEDLMPAMNFDFKVFK